MRYEVKLVGAEADLPRVNAELRLLSSLLRPLHPTRVVQSVYLDTDDGLAMRDNLSGTSSRQKLRFRWYGEGREHVEGQLEWKCRNNSLGSKDVVRLEPMQVGGATRRSFAQALHGGVPPVWQQRLRGRVPAQWIRYRRDYYGSADGDLRITVDRELCAFDQRFDYVLSCDRATPLPALLIVEVKASADHRETIESWLQTVGLRPSKCSKFVLATQPGEGPMPSVFG